MTVLTDNYSRSITLTTQNGQDSYFVTDNAVPIPNSFTISYPSGTDWESLVLPVINAMQPPNL